jgi:TonB family protein
MAMPDSFELGLLPERKMDWRTLASSYGFVVLLLLIVVNLGLIWPDRLQLLQNYHVTELIPRPGLQPKALKLKAPKVSLHAKLLPPVLFAAPKLTVPRDIQRPKQQQAEIAPPKVVMNNFTPTVLKVSGGARPAQIVHTGEFGSSATPTLNAPVQKVQTGGFGDPNGIKGDGKQKARLIAMNTGSFDLPQGTGQGNGSGGANGLKGTVASTGFGNGIANGGSGDGRSNGQGGGIQTGGFGTQSVAQGTGVKPQLDSGLPTTPVQITFKPNPVYTEEAKSLKLEGEVLLEVMFGADGQLHVNRVVRGLGHGLDEAAVVAANKMRFKAALRNGVPANSTAVVHVVFQLAY